MKAARLTIPILALAAAAVLSACSAGGPATAPPAAEARPYECKNPCQTLPYRVRSLPEQDIVTSFQAIEKECAVA